MRTVLIAAAGNLLEWYDFAVYGIFASEIGQAFFPPSSDRNVPLIRAFSVFAGAFVVRPLGGLLFGRIGDTLGREVALLFTILLMALPTLVIGLLPTYADIGLAAPLLLTAMRLLQGIAGGGELPGALVYAIESSDAHHRGQMGALCQATGIGSMLASFVAAMIHLALPDAAVRAWGWRIPFCLGAVLAVLACCARRNFRPTQAFLDEKAGRQQRAAAAAADPANGHHSGGSISAMARSCVSTARGSTGVAAVRIICALPISMAGFYGFFVYIPAYFRSSRLVDAAFELNIAVMLTWAFAMFGFGAIADRTAPKRIGLRGRPACVVLHGLPFVSVCGAIGVAVFAPLLFGSISADCSAQNSNLTLPSPNGTAPLHAPATNWSVATGNSLVSVIVSASANATRENATAGVIDASGEASPCTGASPAYVFTPLLFATAISHACHAGPLQAWMVLSLTDAGSRNAALGIAYNIGAMLMGGATPLIAAALASSSVGMLGAGAYISLAALVSAAALVQSEHTAPILAAERGLLRAAAAAAQSMELAGSRDGPARSASELGTIPTA